MKKVFLSVVVTMIILTGCSTNYMKEGSSLLEEQKYTEAIEAFGKASAEEADAAEAYRGIGISWYEQQDYQQALDAFQKVSENGGAETPELYNLMGVCSMKSEDMQGALGFFAAGITLAGADGQNTGSEEYMALVQEMKFNEIVCYEKQLDWENAKAKSQEYAALYPNDSEGQKEAAFLKTR